MAKDKQNTWFCLLLFICTCRYKECMHCIKCLIIYIFLLNFFIKNLYKSFLISHLVTDLSTLPACNSSGGNPVLQDCSFTFQDHSMLILVKLTVGNYSKNLQTFYMVKVKSVCDVSVPLLLHGAECRK